MSISLHNLKTAKTVNKKSKRVGRGNASGHGTYSTRGIKGQKARSGVSGLKRLGMKQMLLSVPKVRGFKSAYSKNRVVNLESLNGKFKDGALITAAALLKAGLVNGSTGSIKILSRGKLELKNLTVQGLSMSQSARQAIETAGGKII